MRIESIESETPLLEVSAAYVLHLVGNGRLDSVRAELGRLQPAKIVHILHNPGSLPPAADIVNAYQYIFHHAQKKGYETIVVLEDDFTWGRVSMDDGKCVSAFLSRNAHRSLVYHLGCLPAVMVPVGGRTFLTLGCGTHASAYTKSCREWVLKYDRKIRDWDMFLFFHFLRFSFERPLCYQLYGRTANSDQWLKFCGLTPLLRLGTRLLLLDRQAEPGYWVCYTGAKCAPFAGVVALLAAVVWGPRLVRKLKKYVPYNPNPNLPRIS